MANEKRLIDLSAIGERNPNVFNAPKRAYGWNDLLKILKAALTVDAVEVVRCRDCKHCETYDYDGDILCGCTLHSAMLDITPDSFCSYGERKGDD